MTLSVQTNSSAHPLILPFTEEVRSAWLRFLHSRMVRISTFYKLLEEYDAAQISLDHLSEVARASGVYNYVPCSEEHAIAEMRRANGAGAWFICRGTPAYPAELNDLHDAPPYFWAVGDVTLLQRSTLGLVGARKTSSLGTRMSRFWRQP